MRIVAHNGARIWGGAERATAVLLRGLADRGHDVTLLCNDDLVRRESETLGVTAKLCPIGGDVALPHAIRLSRALRKHNPDVFLIGTWKKLFLASLGGRIARVPRVIARVGLETDTARSAKYRFALHRWVDGIAANSERIMDGFVRTEGFDPRRVRLIHNGVRRPTPTAPDGELRRQLGIPVDGFVVGTVARLARQKRIDRLLEVISLTNGLVHCVVAGDGEERDTLASQSNSLGLNGRVHFIGHRNDTASVLDALDAYVVTSDREGLSNAMLEAMAIGLPIISTPVSGAADALAGDSPAGIITTFDAPSIARAIDNLRTNATHRSDLGAAARRRAETTFSFDGMLDRWEGFMAGKDSA